MWHDQKEPLWFLFDFYSLTHEIIYSLKSLTYNRTLKTKRSFKNKNKHSGCRVLIFTLRMWKYTKVLKMIINLRVMDELITRLTGLCLLFEEFISQTAWQEINMIVKSPKYIAMLTDLVSLLNLNNMEQRARICHNGQYIMFILPQPSSVQFSSV